VHLNHHPHVRGGGRRAWMTVLLKGYLRVFNAALRVVSWVWIVVGSLGGLMSLVAARDRWSSTLAFIAVVAAGLLLRRVLPLTAKQLRVFGFPQPED
jgi:hypothetical protein